MEILNQEMITGMAKGWVTAVWVLFVLFAISFMIMLGSDSSSTICPIAGFCSLICFIALAAIGLCAPTVETGRYRYEATFDDSISANEVYEKYEVIERRGDI